MVADLPAGVSLADEGRLTFVTQRGYWTPPYKSCMFAALGSILEWSGYRLPLARRKAQTPPDNFVRQLHLASGVSLDSGSNVSDTKVALQKLLPDAPVKFASVTLPELQQLLSDGAMVRVVVRCGLLPAKLRRFVGDFTGLHAVTLSMYRPSNEVYWMDPMGRPWKGYMGEWVAWGDITPAFKRMSDGRIAVTLSFRDSAVPPPDSDAIIAALKAEVDRLTVKYGDALNAKAEGDASKARILASARSALQGIEDVRVQIEGIALGLAARMNEER